MGSYGPAGTRARGLGQFGPVRTPEKGVCRAEVGLARVCVCARGLSVHACANMRVRARVRGQWCWGGCRRGSFVEPLAGSEPAWRLPLLVPGGHLVLLHSPCLSARCRPPDFPLWPLCASFRVLATTPPGPRAGERGSTGVGARGGRAEGPSRNGRAALCSRRWEQPGLQHCYLRQRPRPAPRRPAPSRSRADAAAAAGRRRRRWEAADGGERSARGEHRPRVSESCGHGGAIAAREYPGTESPRLRRSGSARTRCWGAESRLSSSCTGKAGEVWAAVAGPPRTVIDPLRGRLSGLDPRTQSQIGPRPPPG